MNKLPQKKEWCLSDAGDSTDMLACIRNRNGYCACDFNH